MSRASWECICLGLVLGGSSACGIDQVENLPRIECGADGSNFNTICALPDFLDSALEQRAQAVQVYFKEDPIGTDVCASLWSDEPLPLAETRVEEAYPFPSTELPGAPVDLSSYAALNVFVYAFDQTGEFSVPTAIAGGCVRANIPADVADNNPISSKGMVVTVPIKVRP